MSAGWERKPASKSGAAKGSDEVMWTLPLERGSASLVSSIHACEKEGTNRSSRLPSAIEASVSEEQERLRKGRTIMYLPAGTSEWSPRKEEMTPPNMRGLSGASWKYSFQTFCVLRAKINVSDTSMGSAGERRTPVPSSRAPQAWAGPSFRRLRSSSGTMTSESRENRTHRWRW